MTMKTKKTLQHIAAVAVVLLTLCLVFAAPVSAEDITLTIANAGSSTTPTTFYVNGDNTVSYNLYNILWNSSENYDDVAKYNNPGALLKDGDRVLLPGDMINVTSNHEQYRIYGNITIEGAADGSTIFNVHSTKNYRVFQIYSRYDLQTEANVVLKNFTVEGNNIVDKFNRHGVVLTSYLINLDVENVIFKNLTGQVFSAWAQQTLTNNNGKTYPTVSDNVGITINLKNVVTKNNGALVHFDVAPYNSGNEALPAYGFVHLNYDETCSFEDKTDGNLVYSEEGLNEITYNYKSQCTLFQGNMRVNDNMDITLGSAVAQIGDNYYGTLAEAVAAAAEAGDTVTLLKDVDGEILVSKSLTIDGNGKTITGMINLANAGEKIAVVLKDLTINNPSSYAVKVATEADVTIADSTLTGYNAVYVVNASTGSPDAKGDGSTVSITNSKLSSTNNAGEDETNSFGTVAIFANNTKIEISGSALAAAANNNTQSIVRFGGSTAEKEHTGSSVSIVNSVLDVQTAGKTSIFSKGTSEKGTLMFTLGEGVTANVNPSAYIAGGMEVVQPGDKYLVQKYVDRSSSSSSSSTTEPEEPEQPEEPVVEPETPAAPGEVASSTEVTDGGEVAFETTVVDDETGEQSAPAAADSEIKGVVLPTGTEGTVEFVPVSEQPAPAGQEENTKRVFEINVPTYEKGKAAVIKFQMTVAELAADGKEAADVALWHFDEETGEWTKLVTTFTIVDGVVYFEAITEDFSPFAIIYEDEPVDEPVEEPETPESPAPVLGLLAALGAAVVLRRK